MGLVSVNLSLSSLCDGDCIFCPSNRGERITTKLMSFSLAKKIIDEVSSPEFRRDHPVAKFEIGENGEAFLNPEVINILRYMKSTNPGISTRVFTNFQNLTKERSETILREGLLDSIFFNIDGHNSYNYYQVKRLNFEVLTRNVIDFLNLRKELRARISLTILSITLADYIGKIKRTLGFFPSKLHNPILQDIPDDFALIAEKWSALIDRKMDAIHRFAVVGWAERNKIDVDRIDYQRYSCPNLNRVRNECFVAPNGTWYACCLDSNNELVIGDVGEESLRELYRSKKRIDLIRLLEDGQFHQIDGPCRTVNCCQWLYR